MAQGSREKTKFFGAIRREVNLLREAAWAGSSLYPARNPYHPPPQCLRSACSGLLGYVPRHSHREDGKEEQFFRQMKFL